MKFVGYEDIDFELFPSFSDQFLLLGPNEKDIRSFFTPPIIRYFEENDIYHIESNGEALMIFRRLRLAQSGDITRMIAFCKKFVKKIKDVKK